MKNTIKVIILISLTNIISCKQNPTPTPIPEINIQCQRMMSCYSTNVNLITNPFVIDLVQKAQKSNEPIQCQTAVLEIEKSSNMQCPF